MENGSAKTEESLEKQNNKNGLQSEKTSKSTELTERKINNVHNSETSFPGNGYLNAINVPNYDNLKGMDFSKNKEQSKPKY